MTTTPSTTTTARSERRAVTTMYAGLGLTVVALLAPLVDRATGNVLAEHVRAGYPGYSDGWIDTAVTTYLVYLSALGALGVVAWLWSIRAVTQRLRWARPATTAVFVTGAGIAVFNLLIRDTSGDTGLPPLLGWVGVLPAVAGLAAVVLLWRRS